MAREINAAVCVRAIVPSDAESYRNILQRTSAEDRYCRFFHMVDHFDDVAVERYVETRADTIGLIAEKHGRPLGVAHAFFIAEGCAEIAIVVASDARHLGVGRLLFDRLIAALQQRRCMYVIGYALAQNGALSNLARSVGMLPVSSENGIVTWTLSPAGIPPAERARETQPDVQTGPALLQQPLPAAPSFVIPYLSLRARKESGGSMEVIGVSLLGCRNLLMLRHELLATMLAVQRPAVSLAASALDQAGVIGYRYGQFLIMIIALASRWESLDKPSGGSPNTCTNRAI
jgi:GNAT superfamily N-acetyltransferase